MSRTPIPNTREEQLLRDLLTETFPTESPSAALSERIAAMAAETDAKRHFEAVAPSPKKRSFVPRFRLALSAATVMFLLTGAVLVAPRVMTTQALARVEAAMAKVNSVHMVAYIIKDGKRVKSNETWFQNGQWRIQNEAAGHFQLYKEGRSWSYDPVANIVTVNSKPDGPFSHSPSGFTLAAMLHDLETMGQKPKVIGRSTETIDGKTMERVELETVSNYETTRVTLVVDPETDLPSRMEFTSRTRYGKEGSGVMEMSFNEPLAQSLFEPKFERAPRFIDIARQQKEWNSRLEKGIASKKAGERTITINDVRVNKRGAVFVLYTAGKKPGDQFSDGENRFAGRDWKITLTDSLGTRYQWIDAGDFIVEQPKPRLVNGARLEGDWWVPEVAPEPGQFWHPRTFTLRFELNPKNLHGAGEGQKPFAADYSLVTKFDVPVAASSDGLVPEAVHGLDLGLSDTTVLQHEAIARGELPPGVQPSPELVHDVTGGGEEWFCSYSPDGKLLGSSGGEGVHLWDVASGKLVRALVAKVPERYQPIEAPAFSPDGKAVAMVYEDRSHSLTEINASKLMLWNVADGKLRASWAFPASRDTHVRSFAFAPNGRTLRFVNEVVTLYGGLAKDQFFNRQNGIAQEREALTGKLLSSEVLPHNGFISNAAIGADGGPNWQLLTTQSGDKPEQTKARLWDGATGEVLHDLPIPPQFQIHASALSENLVAIAGTHYEMQGQIRNIGAHEILLFDAKTGKLLRSFDSGQVWVSNLAFSPDGSLLAFESDEYKVGLLETGSAKQRESLTGHYSNLRRVSFSPDGKQLATLDNKGKLLQWKVD